MLQNTSMSVEELRAMDLGDFLMHLRLLMEFKAAEARAYKPKKKVKSADEILGIGPKKGGGTSKVQKRQKFDPSSGQFVDV